MQPHEVAQVGSSETFLLQTRLGRDEGEFVAGEDKVSVLETLTLAWLYILAGNAIVTLESVATGKRFTYKVERKGDERFYFISVLTGPDIYKYLGCLAGEELKYRPDRKRRIGNDAPSRKAWHWLMRCIDQDRDVSGQLVIWHSGRCGRCNRELTTPESIRRGLGPICHEKALS